tara:strand:+ start:693 stop:944 length:252 start_codon:yes stop_codon:yes gene_type:complete
MAIINLHLDLDDNYKNLIRDIYKLFTILIVIQVIFNLLDTKKDFLFNALSGDILNDEIVILLFVIILSVSSYYLIFNKILEIN